jgi:hypothetical protein
MQKYDFKNMPSYTFQNIIEMITLQNLTNNIGMSEQDKKLFAKLNHSLTGELYEKFINLK